MKIEIEKITNYHFKYILTREKGDVEEIVLETRTYLVHDMCHYVVEKKINYVKGFWGMLSSGYSLLELSGKKNPLTDELRFVEQIVGPIQSTYLGQIPRQSFNQYVQHLTFSMQENELKSCLEEIKTLLANWDQLPLHERLVLYWEMNQTNNL